MLRVEVPAGNGIGEPRAVAAAYGAAVTGKLGLNAVTLDALVQPAQPPSGGLVDLLLRTPIVFSLGYMKPMPGFPFGSAANAAFGTPGNGGSFGMADPDTGIGYCYATQPAGVRASRPMRDSSAGGALPRRA
jgi:CubicO group peptidase (beta-lactamase class C family)